MDKIKFKICNTCLLELSIDKFEITMPNDKNFLKKPYIRNKCKDCRVEENRIRISKIPNFYKKQYAEMESEKKKIYIAKKSKQNSSRPGIQGERKIYNASDMGIYTRYKGECSSGARLKRGIKLELAFDQFIMLINSNCLYCGLPNCRGIDRVDSSGSYTVENSVSCCSTCNFMKLDSSKKEFTTHVNKILNYCDSENSCPKIILNRDSSLLVLIRAGRNSGPNTKQKRKIYWDSDKGIYNRYKNDCNRRRGIKRGITFNLSFEQFVFLTNSKCSYCGKENCRGVDRIDSSKPYTIENSAPCCRVCNYMKSDLSYVEFLEHLKKIITFSNNKNIDMSIENINNSENLYEL